MTSIDRSVLHFRSQQRNIGGTRETPPSYITNHNKSAATHVVEGEIILLIWKWRFALSLITGEDGTGPVEELEKKVMILIYGAICFFSLLFSPNGQKIGKTEARWQFHPNLGLKHEQRRASIPPPTFRLLHEIRGLPTDRPTDRTRSTDSMGH